VADLLECLIQIKGVADTPRRLARRVAETADRSWPAADAARRAQHVTRRLLAAERRFCDGLSLMLSCDRPAVPALTAGGDTDDRPETLEACQREFAARRAATVAILDACSADQLNRIGIEPVRGPMTVADLVAVMLAHDTDQLGELVAR
jgi:DinB superfamily